MFNKLKFANPFGNKKQREASKDEQRANDDMFIEITKLELKKERYVLGFIQTTTDSQDAPNYILKQVVNTTKVMDNEVKKQKIEYLEKFGIKTIVDEETARVTGFENIKSE